MSYYVYIHTCPNNKRYIGVTTRNPEYRWNSGKGYRNQIFGRAINKYGWDNIDHKVFEVDTESEMYYLEKYLISYYQTTNPSYGYNKSNGGESGTLGCKLTEITRQRMSQSFKGRKYSQETIKKRNRSLSKTAYAMSRKISIIVDGIYFNSIKEAASHLNCRRSTLANYVKANKDYKDHKIIRVNEN